MVSAILCGPHVLAVHLGDIDLFRGLRLVWVVGARIDPQIPELHPAERSARDHPFDALLDHALGETSLEDRLGGAFLDTADKAGVLVIDLLVALATGQHGM